MYSGLGAWEFRLDGAAHQGKQLAQGAQKASLRCMTVRSAIVL